MTIEFINGLENDLVFLLNMSGWDLKCVADQYSRFDAIGFDLNGKKCIIELKFRKDFYKDKILELKKYDAMMAEDAQKRYYGVIDPEGCWVYDFDDIDLNNGGYLKCPANTIRENAPKEMKPVYYLKRRESYFYRFNFF
jgi:hypothetical protein